MLIEHIGVPMILNLRGTNGSGKSTVARALIGPEEVPLATYATPSGKPRSVIGYRSQGLIVVGPYRTQCGGCDAIPTQNLVCEAVRAAARLAPNVFFEGLLISGLYGRYHTLSNELGGIVWAYLDTPLETCLERVATRNGGKPLKRDGETVKDKYVAVRRTRDRALADGEHVVDIDHTMVIEHVTDLFRLHPWVEAAC